MDVARIFHDTMTDSDLKRYNRILAQDLGRNPAGQALFKWERTRDLHYLIQDEVVGRTPAGIIAKIDQYTVVSWERRLGSAFPWIIAAWQAPGTQAEWLAKYGRIIPYPPHGMYYPISGSEIPCEPTQELTAEVVWKIRRQREESYEQTLLHLKDEHEKDEREVRQQSDDMIDSDLGPWCGQPVVGYTKALKEKSQ